MEILDFSEGMTVALQNPFSNPAFTWPETLIHYRLNFKFKIPNDNVVVVRDSDLKLLPSQMIKYDDGQADIFFLSSLAPSQTRIFTFHLEKPQIFFGLIKKEEIADGLIVSNGKFSIKLPKEGASYINTPAPIISVCKNGKWSGNNYITAPTKPKIKVTEQIFGSIFATYKIEYIFPDNKKYSAIVKFTAGYDFVEIWETAENIEAKDNYCLQYKWDNFKATHKYMSTWPDDLWELQSDNYGDYNWRRANDNVCHCYYGEDPRFQGGSLYGEDSVGKDGDAIRLAPYAPFFGYSIRPCGAYWNENTGESIGIFVNGNDNWDDGEYSIWASADKLAGKYYYEDDTVIWRLPIAEKKRSIGLCCYSRSKDKEWFAFLSGLRSKFIDMGIDADAAKKLTAYPTSYTAYLHNRYVTLNLDRVKDWQLTYDGKHPDNIVFSDTSLKTPEELYKFILSSGRTVIATKGTEEFHERPYTFEAVEIRCIYDTICDSYLRLYKRLSSSQLKEINALLLLTAYICAGEEAIPMKTMLGGHPNFLTDIKCTPALIAFLFPEHRDAKYFTDTFEKFLDLNLRYHTRPDVKTWGSKGGRWTEAIGIYTWAFLSPSALTAALLKTHFDGKSRMAKEKLCMIAHWIMNLSSAPITLDNKKIRALSTQGAHSALRPIPKIFRLIADQLRNFNPLLAENIYYITKDSADFTAEANHKHLKWSFLYKETPPYAKPLLESCKYTGYGSILRYKPYTDEEMSVHLQQIDAGPNYRWGFANAGGCGSIFYYANGKCYSYNGKEDAGDRRADDAAYSTCFGVWKQHCYRSIGQNSIKEPLLALGEIQYQKIISDDIVTYSYPEYKYRSVLLAGGDYISIYDSVLHPKVFTRFSWFVEKNSEYPMIHFVKGITMDRFAIKNYAMSEHFTPQSKGKWFEGSGDCLAIVSHRKDLDITDTEYGCIIKCKDFTDYVINDVTEHTVAIPGGTFRGKVGLIRYTADKDITISAIDAKNIRVNDVMFDVDNSAFCLTFTKDRLYGKIYSSGSGHIHISGVDCPIYLDYKQTSGFDTPAKGIHIFEATPGIMTPSAPVIESIRGKKIIYKPSVGASSYILEYSLDGKTFCQISEQQLFELKQKAIIRITATHDSIQSEYSNEYPYFPVKSVPPAPDGLTVHNGIASWGEVYGATCYNLYKKGQNQPVYSGIERHADNILTGSYYVTAVNEFGESEPSFIYDCENPVLNFYPPTYDMPFSRDYAYLRKPYYTGPMPDINYPD